MIRLSLIFIFIFTCLSSSIYGQKKAYKIQKKQKHNYEAYPNPYDFRSTRWVFDAGITGTKGFTDQSKVTLGDSSFSFSSPIRPGIAITVGRYLSLKKGHKIIKYIDYNLGYKMLWNTEKQDLDIISSSSSESVTNNNIAHYANANLNFNNVISLNDYNFIQNSIGINVDYRFAQNLSSSGYQSQVAPDKFILQLHYKFAWGFMIDNDKALIPYIEIPIFNLTPKQSSFSQLDYFNQSYQSIIVGVRLMLFRLGQKECPKAINYQADPNQQNGY
jgi:hypothetical protein